MPRPRHDQWAVQDRMDPASAPRKTKQALELATLEWGTWFKHHRLLSSIGYIPLAGAEVTASGNLPG